jgi:uncharacterized protein YjiK
MFVHKMHHFTIYSIYFFFYRIIYTVSAKNGGYVEVENRDDYPTDVSVDKYYYNGQTVTRSFTFQWDMEPPYHCSETEDTGTSSCPYPVKIEKKDITSDVCNCVTTITDNPQNRAMLYYSFVRILLQPYI